MFGVGDPDMTMQSLSDLRDRQRQAGAHFDTSEHASTAGEGPPQHFGSPRDEYSVALGKAALFDWTDHALIEFTGADRMSFLHNFCTNDVKRLQPGQGCEAMITNVKGRILGHVWIEAGLASLRLDAGPVTTERLMAHLERYIINEDVAVADRTSQWSELLVMGPAAADSLSFLADVGGLAVSAHVDVETAMGPTRIARRDVGSGPAYVVGAPGASLGQLWEAVSASGASPAGTIAWEALRIEAGLPIFGVDLTDENLAQEAGRTQSAISFTKGCYLGQEPIARLDAMGHVNRELRSLRIESACVPPPGARVFSDADRSTVVGTVTSAAFSFGSECAVALGLVRSSVSAPGTRIFVEIDSAIVPATVFWFPTERGT
jgi:folate-binding protein YgfZ